MVAAGIFYFLAEAGAVSALPAHLMSDHVFLGSALVAMLSAEAVLLAKDIRCHCRAVIGFHRLAKLLSYAAA